MPSPSAVADTAEAAPDAEDVPAQAADAVQDLDDMVS